jgi:site-specific DNA recombinase
MTTSSLQVLGYLRCSTDEQASEGLSLDAQRSRIIAWCEAREPSSSTSSRTSVSRGKALAERPGGERIVRLLEARRPVVDAVVVLRLDRLGRDAAECLALLKRFRTGRVGLVAIADRLDLGTPQGRAILDRIRELRAEGLGYDAVAKRLTAEDLRPKRAAAWSAMSVRSALLTAGRIGTAIA